MNDHQPLAITDFHLRTLVDASPVGMLVVNHREEVTLANPVAKRLFGLLPEDGPAKSCGDVVRCADRLTTQEGCGHAAPCPNCPLFRGLRTVLAGTATPADLEGEAHLNREPGCAPLWIRFTIRPLLIDGERGALLTVDDITAQRLSEERYTMLFREMLNAFALHEIICNDQGRPSDYRFLAANPAFERMTGLAADQIIGRTVLEVLPGIESFWIETYGQVALTGEPARFEHYSQEIGKYFAIHAFCPSPGQFACLFEDITQRKVLIEQSRDGIVILDHQGRAREANQRFADMLGYTREEVHRLHIWDWDARWTREQLLEAIAHIDAAGDFFETTHRRKNGSTFPVEISTNGSILAGEKQVFCICRDISERKRTEQQLLESRDFLHTLLNAIPVRVFWKDTDLRYLGCNHAFAQDAGFTAPDELIGKNDFDLAWRDQAPWYQSIDRQVITHGTARVLFEEVQTTPSGEQIHLLTSKLPLKNEQGAIIGMLGVYSDITELKQANEHLRQRELFLRTVIHASADGFSVVDIDGIIREVNEAYCAMSGFTKEELVGRHVSMIDADETPAQTANRIHRIINQGNDLFESRHHHKDGSLFPIEISVTFLPEQQLFVSFYRDLHERNRMKEEQKQLQAQLVHAQKMEAIGTLAGGIAHDFNNILGAVIGYAEMAREDSPSGSAIARDLDRVLEAGNRAASLVKQILAFSRQQEIKPIALDPGLIVEEVVTFLRPSLPSTIAIHHRIVNKRAVLADPTQLHQLLLNLATNAYQAMEQTGGNLEISVEDADYSEVDLALHPGITPGAFVQFIVADSGPGIPATIKSRIFDPFFTTKAVGRGTGMGLAIVDGIVRSSGGFINCESKPGEGTIFTIALPAHAGETTGTGDETEVTATGHGRILFVDDEVMLTEMGQIMLERLGYEVTTSTSSLEALITFQNDPHRFDAVITDQTMPGMTGLDLARRMLQIRPDLPIILCTGYSNLVDEAQAKAWGIKGFAMKPLTKKEITTLLRETLTKME